MRMTQRIEGQIIAGLTVRSHKQGHGGHPNTNNTSLQEWNAHNDLLMSATQSKAKGSHCMFTWEQCKSCTSRFPAETSITVLIHRVDIFICLPAKEHPHIAEMFPCPLLWYSSTLVLTVHKISLFLWTQKLQEFFPYEATTHVRNRCFRERHPLVLAFCTNKRCFFCCFFFTPLPPDTGNTNPWKDKWTLRPCLRKVHTNVTSQLTAVECRLIPLKPIQPVSHPRGHIPRVKWPFNTRCKQAKWSEMT